MRCSFSKPLNSLVAISLLLSITLIVSCEDFIEEDLSNSTIEILTPRDGLVTGQITQTFYWEPVEFALEYKLQVASPNFDQINILVLDTITTRNKLDLNFSPGSYTWRIKAINNNSETIYFYRSFSVDSSNDLSNAQVVLSTPSSNAYLNINTPVFTWEDLPAAKNYSFKIYEGLFGSGMLATSEMITPQNSLSLPIILSERDYEWGVRGENDQSISPYTTPKTHH
jgi:hypothetical protein